ERHVPDPPGTSSIHTEQDVPKFTDYFRKLFQSRTASAQPPNILSLDNEPPRLSEADRTTLQRPPSLGELDAVVKNAKRDTAPGPDGLPYGFYKTFWPDLRLYFLRLVQSLFDNPVWPPSFTESFITLIPKPASRPDDPSTWRPISLLNCDYKLVAAVLSRRVRDVLEEVIHPAQVCSVPGRSMYSSLSVIRDLFSYTISRSADGIVLSLDQQKAFDCVNHGYLLAVLQHYAFPSDFIDIIG
ncbi:conserved hypothetical protein, partial [Ixodes scapularis]